VASGATATKKAQILNAAAITIPTAIENPRTLSFITHLLEQNADSYIIGPINADGSHPRACRAHASRIRSSRLLTQASKQTIQ
jgi:hypothetical protein